MSEVVISTSPNPPKDWIRQLERQKAALLKREEGLDLRESELDGRDGELDDRENELDLRDEDLEFKDSELRRREVRLDKDTHSRVQEILRNKTELQAMIKSQRRAAIKTSRATLLGRLLERLAPCIPSFSQYDPPSKPTLVMLKRFLRKARGLGFWRPDISGSRCGFFGGAQNLVPPSLF